MSMFKGKGKGRGSGFPKGKGSFQTKGKGSPSLSAALTVTGKGSSSSGPQKPGCFICGSNEHDFRTCPERGVQPASGKEVIRLRPTASLINHEVMGDDIEECEDVIPVSAEAHCMIAQEYPGHAVLDSGAAESVAAFEALEEILQLRALHFGAVKSYVVARQQRKKLKFGESQHAASLIELPQVSNYPHSSSHHGCTRHPSPVVSQNVGQNERRD